MKSTGNDNSNFNVIYNEDILSSLYSTFVTSGGYKGTSIAVGIYDSSATVALKQAIIEAMNNQSNVDFRNNLDKKMEDQKKHAEDYQKNLKNHTQIIRRINDVVDNLGKKLEKEWNENNGFWKNIRDNIFKEYPKWVIVAETIIKIGKTYLDNGARQVEVFQKLVNSGIALEGTTTSLYSRATKVGIAFDDFVNLLSTHSNTYAKLNGLMNDGSKSFDKMVRSAKDVTNDLGLNFKTSVDISSDYLKNNAYLGLMQGKSMNTLIKESEMYARQLVGLSKATGQSTEAINNEIKAREKDNFWRIMNMDPRNKEKIAHMTALGFSQEMMEGILTGVPNAALAQASASKGFSRLLSYFSAGGEFDQLKSEDERLRREKQIGEEISPYNERFLTTMQNNPALLGAYRDMGFVQAAFITKNAAELNLGKTNKGDQEGFKQYSKYEEKLDGMANSIEKSVTPQLIDFGNKLKKVNGILHGMNNFGDWASNYLSKYAFITTIVTSVIGMFGTIYGLRLLGGLAGKLLPRSILKKLPKSWAKGIIKANGGTLRGSWLKGSWFGRGAAGAGAAGALNNASKGAGTAGALNNASKGAGTALKNASKGAGTTGAGTALKNASKGAGTTGAGAALKNASKGVGKKVGAKTLGKSLLKKIPGIGLLAGATFAASRLASGDLLGAGLELASGAASTIPGWGTAGSIGIDAALAARDMKNAGGEELAQTKPKPANNSKLFSKSMLKKTALLGGVGLTGGLAYYGIKKLFDSNDMKSSNEINQEKSKECPCAPYFDEINKNLRKVLESLDNIKDIVNTTSNCCAASSNHLRDISQKDFSFL